MKESDASAKVGVLTRADGTPDFAIKIIALMDLVKGKTAKSILISCGARLAPFDIEEVRNITMYDELSLDTIGDRKTALFLIMSDTDGTFNFLISMIYSQSNGKTYHAERGGY